MNELSDVAFAMFALQQPLTLDEIADGARDRRLPMADPQTPDWFAALATGGASLMDIAPELRVLPAEPEQAPAPDVQGLDLVRIYSDHVAQVEEGAGTEGETSALVDQVKPAVPAGPPPEASRQIGLLKELDGLDE